MAQMANANAIQADELIALQAIYPNQIIMESEKKITFTPSNLDSNERVKLDIDIPQDYPVATAPSYYLSAPHLSAKEKKLLSQKLDTAYLSSPGQPVLYEWFQILENYVLDRRVCPQDAVQQSIEPTSSIELSAKFVEVKSGQPLTDRKSTFQAHVATVKSKQDVLSTLSQLNSNAKIARATHNMYAYRIQRESGHFLQDCDDDGEHQAGSRLLHLLEIADVRDALVVVSRWYGGVMLGADRFKHINNVARQLLEQEGYLKSSKEGKRPCKRH